MNKTSVILVNLGTPAAPTKSAIRAFLRRFLSDKRVVPLPSFLWKPLLNLLILPLRVRKLVYQYQSIWMQNGSPLEVYMRELTQKLQCARPTLTWHYAMSYSAPFLKDVIQNCLNEKIDSLIILPLYPQYASSSTGVVYDQTFEILKGQRYLPHLNIINNYHDHPSYISTLAQHIQQFWQQHPKPQKLVMSFHGIPQNSVNTGDPYAKQCETTARALAKALQLQDSEWLLVYQSRFGKARWLQPYCDRTLQALPVQGVTNVHVICPGFSIDCLETLEEISKTNRELFLNAGGKSYAYIPALNASQQHSEFLIQLLKH